MGKQIVRICNNDKNILIKNNGSKKLTSHVMTKMAFVKISPSKKCIVCNFVAKLQFIKFACRPCTCNLYYWALKAVNFTNSKLRCKPYKLFDFLCAIVS